MRLMNLNIKKEINMYYILARICGLGRGEVISIQVHMNWILHAERVKLLPRFRGDFLEI